jgi:2'-5' RNA ligase
MTVKKVALRHQTFTINLQKIAYGPEGKLPPRYIWLGGEHSEGLVALKQDLEDSLTEVVRYKPDNKSFAPHITLARIKEWEWRSIEPEERPEVNEILDTIFTVESLEVMESELTRLGPRYTVIESHQLQ